MTPEVLFLIAGIVWMAGAYSLFERRDIKMAIFYIIMGIANVFMYFLV